MEILPVAKLRASLCKGGSSDPKSKAPLILPLMALIAGVHAYLDALPNCITRKMPLFTSSIADVQLALSLLIGSTQDPLLDLTDYKLPEVNLFMNQMKSELEECVGIIAQWLSEQPASVGACHFALLSGMDNLASEASAHENCWALAIQTFAREVMGMAVHLQMQEAVSGLKAMESEL